MSSKQSTTWFWSDWAGDEAVRRLSPAERGMWIDLLSMASVGKPPGFVCDERGDPVPLSEIARFANCSADEASNLIDGILRKGAASRDRSGRLFSRRMVRDYELSVKKRRAGIAGAVATQLKWQALTGVSGHLPEQVPGHAGTRPSKKRKITSTSLGAARENARSDRSGSAMADNADADTDPRVTELQAVMIRKGWVKPC
jgi:hypothetical protein